MAPFERLQPSAGGRWRSAGTNSPQGLFVSGLTPLKRSALPVGGAASGRAKPVPRRLLGVGHCRHVADEAGLGRETPDARNEFSAGRGRAANRPRA